MLNALNIYARIRCIEKQTFTRKIRFNIPVTGGKFLYLATVVEYDTSMYTMRTSLDVLTQYLKSGQLPINIPKLPLVMCVQHM